MHKTVTHKELEAGLIAIACRHMGISELMMRDMKRRTHQARARHLVMWGLRRTGLYTHEEAGLVVGAPDHCLSIYAAKKVPELRGVDQAIEDCCRDIEEYLDEVKRHIVPDLKVVPIRPQVESEAPVEQPVESMSIQATIKRGEDMEKATEAAMRLARANKYLA